MTMPKSTNRGASATGNRRVGGEAPLFGLPLDHKVIEYGHERNLQRRIRDDRTMEPKIVVRDEV